MQQVEFGEGKLRNLEIHLKERNPKNIFLVTAKNSFEKCGAKAIIDQLLRSYTYTHFFDFQENPQIEDVRKGVKEFNVLQNDLIIAIGGGSVLDMAKLINHFNDLSPSEIDVKQKISNQLKPMIAIPTTAGSGSESTHFAVVYDNGVKYSIANASLLPPITIVDPLLTYSTSEYLTATSGLDGFAQAVESYWNVNATAESDKYSAEAIQLLWQNLPAALSMNKDAKTKVCYASNLAGRAINITKTTAPHAISYSFTTHFGLAHGHAVAMSLPFFVNYNYGVTDNECNDERGAAYVKERMKTFYALLSANSASDALHKVSDFIDSLRVKIDLKSLGISENDIETKILPEINSERLKNNPRKLEMGQLREYFSTL